MDVTGLTMAYIRVVQCLQAEKRFDQALAGKKAQHGEDSFKLAETYVYRGKHPTSRASL